MTIHNEMPEDDMNAEELARMHKAKLLHTHEFLMSGFVKTLDVLFEHQDLDRMMFLVELLKYVNMCFMFENELFESEQQIKDQNEKTDLDNLDNLWK